MDFNEPGGPVTLLHFTPLPTDDFAPPSYDRCLESAAASFGSVASLGPPPAIALSTGNPPMSCSMPYNYVGSNNCDVYNSLAMEQGPAYCGQQEQMQTTQPLQATYEAEFSVLLGTSPDVGPPPVRLEPPTVDTTLGGNDTAYLSMSSPTFYGEAHSSPHSPMSVGDPAHRKGFGGINKTYPKSKTKSSRRLMLRATSPMFPDQSTPLRILKRQPSVSSITSNRSADQVSTFSFPYSTNSDPSYYSIPNACESGLNSPSVGSSTGHNSPSIESLSGTASPQRSAGMEGSSRSCLELEIPAKYARKINDLDKRILKLQGDRSKILEKIHQTKSASSGLIADVRSSDMDMWLFSEKLPEMGKAHLYIIPLGIHELDEPLYDDASKLLREVGGMYLDLQTSINILRSICCKGMFVPAEISTCFAYIKSLLHKNHNLKLSNLEGMYSIQLDMEEMPPEEVLPMEFAEAMSAANQVLKCAQCITAAYVTVQMDLQKMRQVAVGKLDSCNAICQKLDLVDREKRNYIRTVLEGNCTTMASAERVWPQYYQAATQTIKTITECIHPSM